MNWLAIIIAAIASMVIGSAGAILGLLVGLGFIAPAIFAQARSSDSRVADQLAGLGKRRAPTADPAIVSAAAARAALD